MTIALYLISCYLIGTIMAAYFVGKWYGTNLREANSGNLGARNAGRTLGKAAFFMTMILDALKGASSVLLGFALEISPLIIALGIFFSILGHLYPFWLKFKGGKGIATMAGGFLFFNPLLIAAMVVGMLLSLPITKSLTLSMIGGFITYSIAIMYVDANSYWPLLFALILITWEHRDNLKERVK
ncbi:glycerol-3-phosphate acyltransferase [Solibacillus sp. FSL H8-0538]|uniref:glycerol-3-phosphate acyltransferase n=1 Tax=Solibacillus sp. FSL H8-0538 TaxID=2921400 RepID=UPI0030FAF00F